MVDKEMLESKKLTFDKWMDLAKDIYEIISIANGLREDLVIYIMGHVTLFTDIDGNESKCLVTNGKKLEKDTKKFYSDSIAVLESVKNFKPEQKTKFTIVIWIEGDDPECLDDIIGGSVKLQMDISEEHIENDK